MNSCNYKDLSDLVSLRAQRQDIVSATSHMQNTSSGCLLIVSEFWVWNNAYQSHGLTCNPRGIFTSVLDSNIVPTHKVTRHACDMKIIRSLNSA